MAEVALIANGCSREAWLRYGADALGADLETTEVFELAAGGEAVNATPRGNDGEARLRPPHLDRAGPLRAYPSATPPAASSATRRLGASFETHETDHTADEGFVVTARSRSDLLCGAAEALAALMVDPPSIELREERVCGIKVEAAELVPDDERLFRWLSEVLYLMDAHRFAIRRVVLLRDDEDGVEGLACGEPLDMDRHAVRGAIKAITYHGMEIERRDDGAWRAQVVVDV
ncbi:MAG TPA: archease [Candidatus Binatia bacterium]|nr:archease [Candidatus Binatia bacterium]